MTEKTPPNQTDKMVARVSADLGQFVEKIKPLGKNPRHAFGVDTLIYIHEMLGPEGIVEFTRWAVHPGSGFLPQNQRVRPAPEELRNVLEFVADDYNFNYEPGVTTIHRPKPKPLEASNQEYVRTPQPRDNTMASNWGGFDLIRTATPEQSQDPDFLETTSMHNYMNIDKVARAAARALEAYLDPEKSRAVQR